ncbi:hypothetical protein DRJ04_00195 [Candidatus Aerophobetes bacterium]|uniref:V-type ATP synthase subunit F n=1 Tax=Aerophobetes bacterium TaxID=2030807 RepID=A0A662DMH2_UNCAE|nr:MAG: hypothetical protein DRJ04_00195 [Candidatus Aerophobetes bacterium]
MRAKEGKLLKILVIGDKDISLPFRASGCEAKHVEKPEEGRKMLLEAIEKDEYGIIFIVESMARGCMDIISQISETKALPIVTIIPEIVKVERGAAEERLQQMVKRAVGIELPE